MPPAVQTLWNQLSPAHQALLTELMESLARVDAASEAGVAAPADPHRAQQVAQLAMRGTPLGRPARDAWRTQLDLVRSDPVLQEVFQEARRISAVDRAGASGNAALR